MHRHCYAQDDMKENLAVNDSEIEENGEQNLVSWLINMPGGSDDVCMVGKKKQPIYYTGYQN